MKRYSDSIRKANMQTNSDSNLLYKDRHDATLALIEQLPTGVMQREEWIILALSTGGAVLAQEIAERLDLDFDLLLMEPIYAPNNRECEVAVVSEGKEIVMIDRLIDSFEISRDFIYQEGERRYNDAILKRQNQLRGGDALCKLEDRHILLIDEGCETGLRTMCALKTVLARSIRKVSFATPMIAEDLYQAFELKFDQIYTVHKLKDFISVDYYYRSLPELTGREIMQRVQKSRHFCHNRKENVQNGM